MKPSIFSSRAAMFKPQQLFPLWQRFLQQGWRPRHLVVLLTISSTTLAISTGAYISYRVVRGLILDNLKQNALLKVQRERDNIDRWLAVRKAEVTALSYNPLVRSLDWDLAEPFLLSEAQRLSEFFVLAMVDGNGFVSTTNGSRNETNVIARKHFQRAMAGEIYVSDPLMGKASNVAQVIVAAPIYSLNETNGRPVGEMFGGLQVNRIVQAAQSLEYGEGSYAFALNSEGRPIVHPDPTRMGTLEKPAPSFLEARDSTLRQVAVQMVNRQTNLELVKLEGKWVYVAYLPMHEANWSMALAIPRGNLERGLHALNILASGVGVFLAIAIFAVFRQLLFAENLRARVAQEALLNRLIQRIRASLDLDEILQVTVEEIGRLLDLQRVVFALVDAPSQTLAIRREYTQGVPSAVGQFYFNAHLAQQLQHQETVYLKGVEETPFDLELLAESYLALPIVAPTELQGGFLIGICGKPWQPLAAERELLQVLADQLAIAINQAHLYSQTREQVQLLNETLEDLKTTQSQLVQSEKMSSVGQMVAGVAHEINNPVNFIYGNLPHASQHVDDLLHLIELYKAALVAPTAEIEAFEEEIELEFVTQDLVQILSSMRMGAERIRQIVLSLRNFSRLDEGEKKPVDLHEGIDNTLLLLQHRLKNRIQVIKDYESLPLVDCFPGQVNQVFMNLLSNAVDALEESYTELEMENGTGPNSLKNPTIWIRTQQVDERHVTIAIADNGPGIPLAIQNKIFDPFFTTKPVGKGTGLGLAISYQLLVEGHGGKIQILTPETGGTEFLLTLPINSGQPVASGKSV
ncbi:GAF domain-containing protein [Desertifilum sp. FACHB-1129]|uniref:sensor histidine kinase n=1 Tax=Desertifilum tharense TaxID=1185873 RepID=UPI0009F47F1C|nr:GAF domain-containing protein [Desertifilum sp. FACHB-1129]MDA0212927.1 ATP-binding protein [Cyanobacteria bacterium FC1]